MDTLVRGGNSPSTRVDIWPYSVSCPLRPQAEEQVHIVKLKVLEL